MNVRKDSGLTLLGFLIVLSVTLFFAYAGMRVIPMYLEYYALTNALELLEKDPVSATLTPAKIKQKIQMSLWASYADNNIQDKDVRISKTTGGVKVRVAYQVEKPFLGNIFIVGKFDRAVILRR
ncbi:DUF4845 domain-containing protein [Pseudomonadota bacterium]